MPAAAPRATSYPLAQLVLEYAEEHPDHPPIAELLQLEVVLASDGRELRAPLAEDAELHIPLAELAQTGLDLAPSALRTIHERIVRELNRHGLAGVLVEPDPRDIDPATGGDLRPAGRSDLHLRVWTGRVEGLRTFAWGEPPDRERDTPLYRSIRQHSPLRGPASGAPGDLLRVAALDDYVARLNRHPGRHVDAVISPALEPSGVYVNYRVAQDKPWTLYLNAGNSGTKRTNDYRQRLGLLHTELTGHDDILRLEYVTNGFDRIHGFNASYDVPLLGTQRLRARLFGASSSYEVDFDAAAGPGSPLAFGVAGSEWQIGGQLSANLWQSGRTFVDLVAGLRWQRDHAENDAGRIRGNGSFLIPAAGLRLERRGDTSDLSASADLEGNLPGVWGSDERIDPGLGRLDADRRWQVLRWQGSYSLYLEPLFRARGVGGPLAHELSLRVFGQHAFRHRLIPQEQVLAGGLDTVRGYDRSAAGDSMVGASLEYRAHLPRLLAPRPALRLPLFGDVQLAPAPGGGRLDWDLVLRLFVDAARVRISEPLETFENQQRLLSLGAGLELALRRNVRARLDVGWPLEEGPRSHGDPPLAERGHPEVHVSLTTLY